MASGHWVKLALAAGAAVSSSVVTAQELAPDVLLISRIKRHTAQELARLPNCACLQTIQRSHKPAGGKMRPLDTIRLEVLYEGTRELYASPGARQFTDQHPTAFSSSGMMADGLFALHLKSVLLDGGATYRYQGEANLGGHRQVRYDFEVPVTKSGFFIHIPEGSGTVGLKGSFWADPESFDVLRLEIEADQIPPNLPISEQTTVINYARTRVGSEEVLLPQSGETRMVRFTGEESLNHTELTHCRSFAVQSTVTFGVGTSPQADGPRGPVAAPPEAGQPVAPGLLVAMRLATAITEKVAVGSLIEGTVAGNVSHRGKVVVPGGATVTGRIRRLERYDDLGGYFIVGLEFTEIESGGARQRFYADLQDFDGAAGAERLMTTSRTQTRNQFDGGKDIKTTTESVWITDLPGVGSFFVRGQHLDLPKGFRMVWKTRPLAE
jgi:hypothetical protein